MTQAEKELKAHRCMLEIVKLTEQLAALTEEYMEITIEKGLQNEM